MLRFINKEFYTKLLLLFIIVQPVLDILTYFSIQSLNINVTVGIIFRVLFMVVSLWFIFFGNSSRLKKYVIFYLMAMFVVFGIGLVYNYFAKPIFDPFVELQFVAKTVYFFIMLCSYLLLFTNIDRKNDVSHRILRAVSVAMFIVSLTMFIAILTGTSSSTYEWNKFGFKGWFFSGNELGSIVAVSFPLTYLYALIKSDGLKKVYYFIPVVMLAAVSILIGTKVGYFAVLGAGIIVFLCYLVYWSIQMIRKAKEPLTNMRLIFSFVFLALFLLVTPFSPSFSNVSGDVGAINEQAEQKNNETEQNKSNGEPSEKPGEETEPEQDQKNKEQNLMESPILKIILSSRNIYFTELYNDYLDAAPMQKMFGMGYAGNYKENPKLIEMDFFDLFFSYGIMGFLFILVPFLLIVGLFVKLLFQVPGRLLHPENMLILLSIGLGTGIAFLAGHVLYAPAVNIYLAISMVLLIINMLKLNKQRKEA
ncbi:O-antigen ligase family protein [Halobacillus shinanisalinarum]|uniref:O-antigen ligase family protein n=1 Tax=Halobacillus shinanisalinarum TaxID=2932258 RepID=A0ABY4H3E4_9BACI|nr:O-antigen ligase family protein [Halobacillus shinanisalinarum]UOQ94430.1 O-antigen ligase family protein [Halobacillus shinanisalinarum]